MSIIDNNKVPKISKALDEVEDDKPVEHKLEPVISGGVELKRQSGVGKFFRQLFAEDLKDVRRTFVDDVVTPFVTDTISGILHDGIDLLIPGSKRRLKRSERGLFYNQRTRYDRVRTSLNSGGVFRRSYDRDSRDDDDDDDVEAFDDELFIFATRGKAQDVYDGMEDAIELWNAVSVADLYDLADIKDPKIEWTGKNWGWTSMEGVEIRRRGRKWYLYLPKVKDIRDAK